MKQEQHRRPRMGRPALICAFGAVALAACSEPTQRHRVDFRLTEQGVCQLGGEPVECSEAGRLAAAQWGGGAAVSAVLFVAASAPAPALLALRNGLQQAHVDHVQYGDPAHQRPDAKPGADQ